MPANVLELLDVLFMTFDRTLLPKLCMGEAGSSSAPDCAPDMRIAEQVQAALKVGYSMFTGTPVPPQAPPSHLVCWHPCPTPSLPVWSCAGCSQESGACITPARPSLSEPLPLDVL